MGVALGVEEGEVVGCPVGSEVVKVNKVGASVGDIEGGLVGFP